jgi:hypothetical protein
LELYCHGTAERQLVESAAEAVFAGLARHFPRLWPHHVGNEGLRIFVVADRPDHDQ